MMYIFIIICLLSQIILGDMAMGVSEEHLYNCFIYMFFHSGWLHLIINVLSLVILWKPIAKLWEKRYNKGRVWLWILCYLGSVLAGIICVGDVPTVGASGLVFFLLGVLLMLNPTIAQLKRYVWVGITVVAQIIIGHSNVKLHITTFVMGMLIIICRESINRLNEYRGIYKY